MKNKLFTLAGCGQEWGIGMKIAICDDMLSVCSELEKILMACSWSINEIFDVEVYYTGEKLCDDLNGGICFDMFFLDIEMPGMDGLSISKCIREDMKNYEAAIVYISSHEGYAMELFQFRPFDFLIKPLRREAVNEVIEEYMKFCGRNFSVFRYGEGRKEVVSYTKDILYFTINSRLIEMHTVWKKELFYGKLKEVAAKLEGQQFFYANKSQLVNGRRIKSWGYDALEMENGEKIPVSQGRRKKVAEIHKEYVKKGW